MGGEPRCVRCWLIILTWVFGCCSSVLSAEDISLNAFLNQIRARHPFLMKEALAADIARKQQQRFLGEQDWQAAAGAEYTHNDTAEIGFGTIDAFDAVSVDAGVGREVWRTGGRVDLFYNYTYRDQEFNQSLAPIPGESTIDLAGPSRFYRNAVGAAYVQPLWRNRGDVLSRLEYDLQGYAADQTELLVLERQEGFLLRQALAFLDWVRLEEERQIAGRRLDLSEQQLASTRKRFDANLVEEADLFRAKNALLEAQRNLRLVDSSWKARQAELATQAQDASLLGRRPGFDLYALRTLPDPEPVVAALRSRARLIRQLELRADQLAREREGLASQGKPAVDLVIAGGLKDGEQAFDDAVDFDQPDATIAVEYRYPLGNRTARADLARNALEREQIRREVEDVMLSLESDARSILTQLAELEGVLALNAEQVQTAREKTEAEEALYRQGRNQLNFVIQSRDEEAVARQVYALNAVDYHGLWLRLQALRDELLRGGSP